MYTIENSIHVARLWKAEDSLAIIMHVILYLASSEAFDDRLPALIGELHVCTLARLKDDVATLVESSQPDPVFNIEGLETHGHDRFVAVRIIAVRVCVGPEPAALLWHDSLVVGENDED